MVPTGFESNPSSSYSHLDPSLSSGSNDEWLMGPGHNVVLFDPCAATHEEVTHHRVDGVTFKASNVGPYERPHEDVFWLD